MHMCNFECACSPQYASSYSPHYISVYVNDIQLHVEHLEYAWHFLEDLYRNKRSSIAATLQALAAKAVEVHLKQTVLHSNDKKYRYLQFI